MSPQNKPLIVRVPRTLLVTLAFSLCSMGVSGYVAYSHETETTQTRLTVVEVRQAANDDRLNRIESKIDRLIDWALGKQ